MTNALEAAQVNASRPAERAGHEDVLPAARVAEGALVAHQFLARTAPQGGTGAAEPPTLVVPPRGAVLADEDVAPVARVDQVTLAVRVVARDPRHRVAAGLAQVGGAALTERRLAQLAGGVTGGFGAHAAVPASDLLHNGLQRVFILIIHLRN